MVKSHILSPIFKHKYPILLPPIFTISLLLYVSLFCGFVGSASPFPYSSSTVVEAPLLYSHNPYWISLLDFPIPPDFFIYYFGSGGSNPFNTVANLTGFYIYVGKTGTPSYNLNWILYEYNYTSNPTFSDISSVDSGSIDKNTIIDISSSENHGISVSFTNPINNIAGRGYAISLDCNGCDINNSYYIVGSDSSNFFYDFNNSAYFNSIDKVTGYTSPNETPILKWDSYYLNNIYISIEGNYNYPILPPPTPTPTPTPSATDIPSTNYTYNNSGQGEWDSYTNTTISSWNNSIQNIFTVISSPITNIRNGIQTINSTLNTTFYNNTYIPIITVMIPAIVNTFPDKVKALITLSLVFTVILTIMRRR